LEDVAEVGYFGRLRQFSRNARLYLLHVIGMDLIHGAWEVLFNLYLLAVGFDIRFVGIRIAVLGIAGSLAAIPRADSPTALTANGGSSSEMVVGRLAP